ncbi:hypothetical protein ACVSIM_004353 [Escherichia coli]
MKYLTFTDKKLQLQLQWKNTKSHHARLLTRILPIERRANN